MSTMTKRLAWALAVSVALNLFFAGFLTARSLAGHHHGRSGKDRHGLFLGPRGLMGAGGAGVEEEVERIMDRHGSQLRESRRGLRASRRAVRDALSADPFERDALAQALSTLRERTSQSQAAMHAAMLDLAEQLPRDQRLRLGRKLRGGRHR